MLKEFVQEKQVCWLHFHTNEAKKHPYISLQLTNLHKYRIFASMNSHNIIILLLSVSRVVKT